VKLEKGKKYTIVRGSDYWQLRESLRYAQRNDHYYKHPARFSVQAEEGNKAIELITMVVYTLQAEDGISLEVRGYEMGLGGNLKHKLLISYNPEDRVGSMQVL